MIVDLDYLPFVTSAALNVCALSQLPATQGYVTGYMQIDVSSFAMSVNRVTCAKLWIEETKKWRKSGKPEKWGMGSIHEMGSVADSCGLLVKQTF
jgi:hypothetical protein